MTDPGWLVIVNASALVATTGLFLVNVWQTSRLRRRFQALVETEREVQTRLTHAVVLERVLAGLCCNALARTSIPVWQAWRHTMGDIDIQVTFARRGPPSDDLEDKDRANASTDDDTA